MDLNGNLCRAAPLGVSYGDKKSRPVVGSGGGGGSGDCNWMMREIGAAVQGSAKRWSPGCVKAADKAR